eukprot:3266049-Amphidinium_carterae.3
MYSFVWTPGVRGRVKADCLNGPYQTCGVVRYDAWRRGSLGEGPLSLDLSIIPQAPDNVSAVMGCDLLDAVPIEDDEDWHT